MDYETDALVEGYLRRVAWLEDEYEEMKQRLGRDDNGAEVLAAIQRAKAEEEEQARQEAEEQDRLALEARAEQERAEAEAREQREAIARAIAARKSNDVVLPIDDDGDDPEAQYYRRESWLV